MLSCWFVLMFCFWVSVCSTVNCFSIRNVQHSICVNLRINLRNLREQRCYLFCKWPEADAFLLPQIYAKQRHNQTFTNNAPLRGAHTEHDSSATNNAPLQGAHTKRDSSATNNAPLRGAHTKHDSSAINIAPLRGAALYSIRD